jgi:hypothetical protein
MDRAWSRTQNPMILGLILCQYANFTYRLRLHTVYTYLYISCISAVEVETLYREVLTFVGRLTVLCFTATGTEGFYCMQGETGSTW